MLNTKIKSLQTDGVGEYQGHDFKKNLATNGISHRVTCPHTLEQNGVTERKHQHIVDMTLSLMAHSKVSKEFWFYAFETSMFLINRLPT